MIDLKDSSTRLIRILLLLTIHSSNKSNYSKTYQILGFLTRQCLSIGLNKFQEPGSMRYTKLSKYDLEMRHRLFWSVYNIDRSISITIGCPVSIDDDDINVPLPKYLDNDEPHLVDLIRNTIEINRIRGSLLKEIYSLRAKDRYIKNFEKLSIINTIRNDIENWYINSNNFLMSSFREKEDKLRDNTGNRGSVSRKNSLSSKLLEKVTENVKKKLTMSLKRKTQKLTVIAQVIRNCPIWIRTARFHIFYLNPKLSNQF
ncbi:unnamed protein product [[Candida] boidinii]|nr:unnamed protein product [[Candida] boidinii]